MKDIQSFNDNDADFYAQVYKLNGMFYFESHCIDLQQKYKEYITQKKYNGTFNLPFTLIQPQRISSTVILFRNVIHIYHDNGFAYRSVTNNYDIRFKNYPNHSHVHIWYHSYFVDKTIYSSFKDYQKAMLIYIKIKNL
jgi:hypothetical protein